MGAGDCEQWRLRASTYTGNETKIVPGDSATSPMPGHWSRELIALLPRVRAVILGGKAAQKGWQDHRPEAVNIREFAYPHPSVTNVNTHPEVWPAVVAAWRSGAASAIT